MPDSEDEEDNREFIGKELESKQGEIRTHLQKVPKPTKSEKS